MPASETYPDEPAGVGDPPEEWDPLGHERQAFRRFIALTKLKRELADRLKEIESQTDALAMQLRDYLGAAGFDSIRIDGWTVFIRREIWARKFDWAATEAVVKALRANGLGHYVKESYNVLSLSQHVRQLELKHHEEFRDGTLEKISQLLPPGLAEVLNVEPSYQVVAHRGKNAR